MPFVDVEQFLIVEGDRLVSSWLLQFAPGQEWTKTAGRSWSYCHSLAWTAWGRMKVVAESMKIRYGKQV